MIWNTSANHNTSSPYGFSVESVCRLWACVLKVECSDRGCWSSEGEAEQHEQRDEFVSWVHIGHAEGGLVTAVAPLGWLEELGELQQVQRQHGGRYDGQLQHNNMLLGYQVTCC